MDALRKIKNIFTIGIKYLKNAMDMCYLSPLAEETIEKHGLQFGTYLEVLQSGLIVYLNTECKEMKNENKIIQGISCEILEILFRNLTIDLAFIALDHVFACLFRAVTNENILMQLQLLKIITPLIYECHIETNKQKCQEFFLSQCAVDSISKGLRTQETYLRSH